jgi:hypothetical protein
MKIKKNSSQVFIDDFEYCKTQVEFAKRFKEDAFPEFIEHFNMLWGIDCNNKDDKDYLFVLYKYVKALEVEL